jgi:hypothetical protein
MPARCHGCACLLALSVLAGCAARPDYRADRAFEVSAAWIGGRAAVAWYGGHLTHEALFLGWLDARGRLAGPPLQLTDASWDAFEPSLQPLEGDALVAWYEQAGAAGAPARQIAWLARFDSAGSVLWRRQLSAEGVRGRIPVVRVAGSVIHAAWLEQEGQGLPVLRVASLDAAGNWLHAARDAAPAGLETWNLNAAVDMHGRFHVVFDSEAGSRARELHWVIAGGEMAEHRALRIDDGHASVFPDIATEGSRYAISWVDSSDGNDEVYLRCGEFSVNGAPAVQPPAETAATHRVTRSAGQSLGAYAAWHAGDVELAWIESSGERSQLWHQRFDRYCRPRSVAERVPAWGEAGIPSLAASPAGLLLAWNAMRGPVSFLQLKVWPTRAVSPSAAVR